MHTKIYSSVFFSGGKTCKMCFSFDLTFCNDKFYTAIVPSRLRMISDSSHSHGWSEWLSDSEAENVEEELAVYDNLKHSLSFSSDTGDR